MPTKLEIAAYWVTRADYDLTCSSEELSCFACGYCFNGRYDSTPEKIPLDKAHIIPRSFGGENSVENLVLLCKECHSKAPMTNNVDEFLSWCENRDNYLVIKVKEIQDELVKENIDVKMETESFIAWLKKQTVGIHANLYFGPQVTTGSYTTLIKRYLKENRRNSWETTPIIDV